MVCPCCPCGAVAGATGFGVSMISGYVCQSIGIQVPVPTSRLGKVVSNVLSGALTITTVLALKIFQGISICGGGGMILTAILRAAASSLCIALVYNIGINLILDRYFPFSKTSVS